MKNNTIGKIVFVVVIAFSVLNGGGFDKFYHKFGELKTNKGYETTNKKMKKLAKKYGYYATASEVKDALKGRTIDGKKIIVVDSRTKKEQDGLRLKGAIYSNLRGWNKSFESKQLHSDNISAIYNYCRTGTDVAGNIFTMQWLFQGKGKIFGLKDMVEACYPVVSKSGNVLDAKLNVKGIYVQQAKDGNYYEVNCKAVKKSCTPVEVFTALDIELAADDNETLPDTFVVKNKYLNQSTILYRGKDNKYYRDGCI